MDAGYLEAWLLIDDIVNGLSFPLMTKDPKDPELKRLGLRSIAALEAARRIAPEDPDVWLRYLGGTVGQRSASDQVRELQILVRRHPYFKQARLLLAKTLRRSGRTEEAVDELKRLLTQRRGDTAIFLEARWKVREMLEPLGRDEEILQFHELEALHCTKEIKAFEAFKSGLERSEAAPRRPSPRGQKRDAPLTRRAAEEYLKNLAGRPAPPLAQDRATREGVLPAAYREYRIAYVLTYYSSPDGDGTEQSAREARASAKAAVDLDPRFSEAWALVAKSSDLVAHYIVSEANMLTDEAKALRIEAALAMSLAHTLAPDDPALWLEALSFAENAPPLDSLANDPASMLRRYEALVKSHPTFPAGRRALAEHYLAGGRIATAIEQYFILLDQRRQATAVHEQALDRLRSLFESTDRLRELAPYYEFDEQYCAKQKERFNQLERRLQK